ncbi:hypothetical protein AVEN_142625-1, partial [Araneus ventricosus]
VRSSCEGELAVKLPGCGCGVLGTVKELRACLKGVAYYVFFQPLSSTINKDFVFRSMEPVFTPR